MRNPLTTTDEVRNEFSDIAIRGRLYLIEFAIAVNNGREVPSDVKAELQELGERLLLARQAEARLADQDEPARPDYLDPAPPPEEP